MNTTREPYFSTLSGEPTDILSAVSMNEYPTMQSSGFPTESRSRSMERNMNMRLVWFEFQVNVALREWWQHALQSYSYVSYNHFFSFTEPLYHTMWLEYHFSHYLLWAEQRTSQCMIVLMRILSPVITNSLWPALSTPVWRRELPASRALEWLLWMEQVRTPVSLIIV